VCFYCFYHICGMLQPKTVVDCDYVRPPPGFAVCCPADVSPGMLDFVAAML